ncbi:putative hydrolase [Alkalithermobacter thermoalcaliphilus JW-YL-7 = DSM 7308]|uniref:Hydrolase n=1 Tax=Alkalithermobacter thermoalcaliphilus JW-YL-7 = DSM 7308 TaxID=1121328 RepID=A0A150FS85_CLOPD|nr:PHP domain protein [[Clostridium] paradoxum JW-YL-7 = DSM 7308]SHL15666.1 putative hydrolase [[Clostridium] paradoxum JW-YL-7 = DSM 7308]
MRVIADYHTHTIYSHGKGTIEDNVKAAIDKGLKTIGISDHGYKHLGFGVKYKDIPKMRKEIDALREKYPQINILMGIEANILDDEGNIDVDEKTLKYFDYIMAGYHFGSMPTRILRGSFYHILNFMGPLKKLSLDYNTKAVINAMKRHNIFIITHPGAKAMINLKEVAKVAKETDTALEINSHHGHLTVDELLLIKDTKVKFAIGSDAHTPEDVGKFTSAIERVKKANIDKGQIINVD